MRVSSLQQQDFERSLSYQVTSTRRFHLLPVTSSTDTHYSYIREFWQDRWPRQMRSKLPLLPTSAVGALPRPPVPHNEVRFSLYIFPIH